MELLHDLVWNCRKIEEKDAEVRLHIFIFVEIFNEFSSVGDHRADVVESFNIVVICQNVVPWCSLNASFRNLDLFKFLDDFYVLDFETISIFDVVILA